MEVYTNNAISGERITTLINQNKETFSLAISDAVVVGKLLFTVNSIIYVVQILTRNFAH